MRRLLIVLTLLFVITGCTSNPLQRTTPSEPVGASTSSTPASITMPDVVGQNAAVAADKLKKLGFTNIDFGTVDGRQFVALPQNWTVKTQSTPPGENLRADAKIVLGCAKV
jgi:beta-lactam-binding protein with PASTA domain